MDVPPMSAVRRCSRHSIRSHSGSGLPYGSGPSVGVGSGLLDLGREAVSGVATSLQDRDLVDLRWLEVVPEDPSRAVVLALYVDHGSGRGDHVDREVVIDHREVLA